MGLAGAGYGASMGLEDLLKQRFLEQIQRAKLAEDVRQADMTHGVQQAQLGQGQQRIGLEQQGLDERTREFDEGAPGRQATTEHLNAGTAELNRRPAEDAAQRAFTAGEADKSRTFTGGQGDLTRQNAVRIAGMHNQGALAVANARPQPLATVNTVDDSGDAVTKFVSKKAGDEYKKPANATTATRTASAKVVNEVGSDIIRKLSDPQYAAVVGPAMGRASSLRDLIGNPPPEFAELAGQIESYSLANMGVHGMRSAQGAEMIKKLLDQRHTPESLAATIRGLNDFSTRFVENNTPTAGAKPQGQAPAGGNNTGVIRARDPQGGLHEAKAGTKLPQGWVLEK